MKLDHNQIHTWTDLVKAWNAQFDHVVDTVLDCMSLMTMENKEVESTHLTENETTFIFYKYSSRSLL